MLPCILLYVTLVAVWVCKITHTVTGQDGQTECEKLRCIQRDQDTNFNCSISTWVPVNGEFCVQPERLNRPECTSVRVDKSGITASISEDNERIHIKVFTMYLRACRSA